MARKQTVIEPALDTALQDELMASLFDERQLPDPAPTPRPRAPRAPKQVVSKPAVSRRRQVWPLIRVVLASAATLLAIFAIAGAYLRTERFLLHDERFALASPEELGGDSPSIRLYRVRYASRTQISQLFERDYGRSIFNMPLKQRRLELLRLDWVRDASISRVWPNMVRIHLEERTAVAFVLTNGTGTSGGTYALIDRDGIFLPTPPKSSFQLPVLTGIHPDESIELRKQKVGVAMRLLKDAGSIGNRFSEIDLLHPDNISVTETMDGRAYTLILGSQEFLAKLRSFESYYNEIIRRQPEATTFDLRVPDRISVAQGAAVGK